jgi:hypothetical protein
MRVIDGLEIWMQQQATYSIGFLDMFIGSSKRSRVLVQAQGDGRLANKKLRILTMLQKQHVKAIRREEHAEGLTGDEEEQSGSRCFGLVDGADIS